VVNIMTKMLKIGFILTTISIVLNQFTSTPCFITGVLIGAGIMLQLIGLLPEEKYQALRRFKKNILTKS